MRVGLIIGALLGLAVATVLIVHFGWRQVADAALAVGWQGLAVLIGIYLVCLLLCAVAWRLLILDAPPRAVLICLWARWLRESVGNLIALLPTAGEIAGARELALAGVRPGMAGASIVVDLTLEILSQIVFTLFGLALLITWYRGLAIGPWLVTGITLSVLAAGGFILAQRQGLFRFLERLPERFDVKWAWSVLPDAEGIHAGLRAIYRHRARVLSSGAIHLAAWAAGAGEAYAGLSFMGHAIAWSDALILESIAFALRTAAFVIPSRLGIQEGGYILIGALFGLSPEVALALSLLKRGRELVTGLPCLVIWQSIETRRLWAKGRRAKSPG
ncbi:lysylphosphatidylglycerol synthase domain-containing protein [Methyloceanibacter sp.]|uniref:lysylphosphatidylglycerol synthase domain-containing protein n=1 Tax=Methyloceanibacter sp. TaxID=1965321 RepID=UPI002D73DF39|nr:lysylphosphatidylglycerol synthase domain-containing protein [Methyloceanibacter sp.]HZP09856.1 lysylphosphatidylglycerol synthase domain-containing protein [Methyloceanibacter sp.]